MYAHVSTWGIHKLVWVTHRTSGAATHVKMPSDHNLAFELDGLNQVPNLRVWSWLGSCICDLLLAKYTKKLHNLQYSACPKNSSWKLILQGHSQLAAQRGW